jgi:hypothetical protein
MNPETDVRPTASRILTDVLPPVLFVLVLTLLAGALYELNNPLVQYITGNNLQYSVAGTSAPSEFGAALIYVIPVIVFTFVMAYLVKKRKAWVLPVVLVGAFAVSSFLIALLAYWWIEWYVAIAIPVFLGAAFLLSMRSRIPRSWSSPLRLPFQVWLGTGTAMLFVILFPLVTLLALCGMMAVWDLYAVLRGPLGKMVSDMKEQEGNGGEEDRNRVGIGNMLMAQIGGSGIGLGDIVFYSIITMVAFGLSALTGVVMIAVVALGAFITFYILRTRKHLALPGLPIPMLFGFVVLLGAWVH